jgi:hypothetical protein
MNREDSVLRSILLFPAAACLFFGCNLVNPPETAIQLSMVFGSKVEAAHTIVLPSEPAVYEQTAARELANYLQKISGATFAIVDEDAYDGEGPVISVGGTERSASAFPDLDADALDPDAIVMKTKDGDLYLNGQGTRGALYAVYSFLQDHCGVRWWTSEASHVPVNRDLAIPELDIVYAPPMEYREPFYYDMTEKSYGRLGKVTDRQVRFAARMRNNGHFSAVTPEWGGKLPILGWAHTMNLLLPLEKYGSRKGWFSTPHRWSAQPCLTNEELRDELIKNARKWLDENPGTRVISISQNDSKFPCQCANCVRLKDREGSQSGPLLAFVNIVAEDLEKSHPGILVETLAYSITEIPPKTVRPRDNVIIRLAPIGASWAHPLDTAGNERNEAVMKNLKRWSEISKRLHIWDYTVNYSFLTLPHPNLFCLGPNIKTYAEQGVSGVFAQGNVYSPVGDMDELKSWVISRMLWNPSLDPDALIREFIDGYYGTAASSIMAYCQLLREAVDDPNVTTYQRGSFLDLTFANEATRLLEKAMRLVAGDPDLEARVAKVKLSVDHLWLLNWNRLNNEARTEKLPFEGPADPLKALESFRADCRRLKCTHYREGSGYTNTMDGYLDRVKLKFIPPAAPLPPPLDGIDPEEMIEVPEWALGLFNGAKVVDDPLASNGKAAVMPGNHAGWNIQYRDTYHAGIRGRWRAYAVVRCDVTDSKGDGIVFRIHGVDEGATYPQVSAKAERFQDGRYRLLELDPVVDLDAPQTTIYLVARENSGMKNIYVDRLLFVRSDKGSNNESEAPKERIH